MRRRLSESYEIYAEYLDDPGMTSVEDRAEDYYYDTKEAAIKAARDLASSYAEAIAVDVYRSDDNEGTVDGESEGEIVYSIANKPKRIVAALCRKHRGAFCEFDEYLDTGSIEESSNPIDKGNVYDAVDDEIFSASEAGYDFDRSNSVNIRNLCFGKVEAMTRGTLRKKKKRAEVAVIFVVQTNNEAYKTIGVTIVGNKRQRTGEDLVEAAEKFFAK